LRTNPKKNRFHLTHSFRNGFIDRRIEWPVERDKPEWEDFVDFGIRSASQFGAHLDADLGQVIPHGDGLGGQLETVDSSALGPSCGEFDGDP
jgi:hypothetical protein